MKVSFFFGYLYYNHVQKRHLQGAKIMRLCGFWGYFRIFMWLFLLCGYAVIRIILFLNLPLFVKIPLILPNLSHFSVTIRLIFVISLAIFVCLQNKRRKLSNDLTRLNQVLQEALLKKPKNKR